MTIANIMVSRDLINGHQLGAGNTKILNKHTSEPHLVAIGRESVDPKVKGAVNGILFFRLVMPFLN